MGLYLNPDIFFYVDGTDVVLWDFKNHQQFAVDKEHFSRIIELARSGTAPDPSLAVDCTLVESGVASAVPFAANAWGWDILSRIFHVGTRDIPQESIAENAHDWAVQYVDACQELVSESNPFDRGSPTFGGSIRLPGPQQTEAQPSGSLLEALLQRQTCREFFTDAVGLDTLSAVLYFSLAHIPERSASVHEFVPDGFRMRRTSPSGGGLNSTSAFLLVRRVDGLAEGVYRYLAHDHSLEPVKGPVAIDDISFGDLFMGQHFSDDIPFGIFLVGEFSRMWWKYPHSRAYRVSLLEAGHISQTFQLLATSLGLRTWLTAAFQDSVADALLGLESPTQQPLLFVGAGYSSGNSLDRARREVLEAP